MDKQPSVLLVALALALDAPVSGSPAPADASQEPGQWALRLTGVAIRYDGGRSYSCGHSCQVEVEIDDVAAGLGVAVEYRVLRCLGLELSTTALAAAAYDYHSVDFGVGFSTSGELEIQPLLLGLKVHLTPASRLDLYTGVLYGHVFLEDGRFRPEDDDDAVGFQIGGDWPLRFGRWFLHGDLRYIDVLVRERSFFKLGYFSVGLGVGYRF